MNPRKESIIREIPLFASLPATEIHRLAESLQMVAFPADALLFREGEEGDRFYIILDGEVEIIKAMGMSEERLIGTCGRGEYTGEMSLLNPDRKRTASARTRTPVHAAVVTRADFDALLHREPSVAYAMTHILSARLTDTHNAAIADLQEKNRRLRAAYEELQAAQAQIIEKEKLEHELQVARQIQESILPREMPRLAGFDFGARMIPTRAVGGDFFDFVPLGETHIGIAIADVSDKGMPSAIFMALARSLLRAEALRSRSPRRVLQSVNRLLLEMNDAGMFVTMVYGVLDRATREFHYARAGHDVPLVFGKTRPLFAPKPKHTLPLGIFPNSALDVQRVGLTRGDTLFLFILLCQIEIFVLCWGHDQETTFTPSPQHADARTRRVFGSIPGALYPTGKPACR